MTFLHWRCGRCRARRWFWQRSCHDCAETIEIMARLGARTARRMRVVDDDVVVTDYTRDEERRPLPEKP